MDIDDDLINRASEDISDEGADPVVREVDVVVSQTFAKQLSVLHHPLQAWSTGQDLPRKARVKPRNRLFEFEHGIDDTGDNYDPGVPDYMLLRHQLLQSTRVEPVTNYCVGRLQDGAVHITSNENEVQMRPSFKQVDDHDEKKDGPHDAFGNPEPAAKENGNGKDSEKEEIIRVEYKKKESDRAASARKQSFAHKRSQEEGEQWVELQVEQMTPERWEEMTGDASNELEVEPLTTSYTSRLSYHQSSAPAMGSAEAGAAPSTAVDLTVEHGGPAQFQSEPDTFSHLKGESSVLGYLRRAGVIPNSMLMAVAQLEKEKECMGYARQHARLLRGNWCIKSSLSKLCLGQPEYVQVRDAMMLLLHRYGAITKDDIVVKIGFNRSRVYQPMLENMAKLDKKNKCWVPKLADNVEFIKEHPAFASAMEREWDILQQDITSKLGIGNQLMTPPRCPHPGPAQFLDEATASFPEPDLMDVEMDVEPAKAEEEHKQAKQVKETKVKVEAPPKTQSRPVLTKRCRSELSHVLTLPGLVCSQHQRKGWSHRSYDRGWERCWEAPGQAKS
ncbi:unnamed protein product [Chrysoparadoxa australica]